MNQRIVAALLASAASVSAGELKFQHHYIDRELPGNSYGQTCLVDVDKDGDLDFITGGNADGKSAMGLRSAMKKPRHVGLGSTRRNWIFATATAGVPTASRWCSGSSVSPAAGTFQRYEKGPAFKACSGMAAPPIFRVDRPAISLPRAGRVPCSSPRRLC
jgi:hypothetical protein